MKTILQLYRDNAARVKPTNLIANAGEPTIYIYDIISADWGVGAMDVIADIAAVGNVPELNVRISSPGGDVFESRAIMNAIKRFSGKTIAHIDSLCASAATSIALACDEVVMSNDSMFMIHNAQGMAYGDKAALRATADLMETVELAIISDYTAKTGMDDEEVKAMMNEETWLTAPQALQKGFIDRIADNKSTPVNTWNLSAYAKAPQALTAPADAAPAPAESAHPSDPEPEPAPSLVPEPTPAPEASTPTPPASGMTQTNQNRLNLLLVS